jgi:hypothetical protein
MSKVDNQIQAALRAATELQDPIPEPTFTEEFLGSSFKGRHNWLIMIGWAKSFAILALMGFCIYQFFQQESVMAMLAYACLAIFCFVSHAAIMLFVWMQIHHNTAITEVKKLELQIMLLLKQLQKEP